eukprot:32422-Eustigmatos_ZCMA.PRE.1
MQHHYSLYRIHSSNRQTGNRLHQAAFPSLPAYLQGECPPCPSCAAGIATPVFSPPLSVQSHARLHYIE